MKFGKIVSLFAIASLLASPAYAGKYGGSSYSGSSSSYRGSTSSSSSMGSRSSNYGYGSSTVSMRSSSSPTTSSSSRLTRSGYTPSSTNTRTNTSPSSNNNYGYNYKQSQGSNLSRNNQNYNQNYNSGYNQPNTVVHHYDSPMGGTFSSPWFWMWAMDRNHTQTVVQQPVVVSAQPAQNQVVQAQGDPSVVQMAPTQSLGQQDSGYSFFGYIWYFMLILIQVFVLAVFCYMLWWLFKRFILSRFR